MPTIVLSYRRDDSKWIAGRIFDRLEGHYGRGNVFMDIDTIPVGLDFREYLQESLDRCDILLAVVGPRWLGTDEHGHHAIAEETDWVRIEIETALAKKIPVIPILIDRLRMPKASDLPETLRDFAFRQAAEVDSGVDFRSHMERLIRSMDQYLQGRSAAPSAGQLADAAKEEAKSPGGSPVAPAVAPSQEPVVSAPAAAQEAVPPAPAPSEQAVAPVPHPLPSLSLRDVFSTARSAAESWIGVAGLLLASAATAVLSDGIAGSTNRLLFIALLALPLGATALISISLHLAKWTRARRHDIGVRLSMLGIGVVLTGAIPTFVHSVNLSEHYTGAATWALFLLGGFGLALIVIALISHSVEASSGTIYVMTCVGLGALLLALAWLDSDVTAPNTWITDWQVRSVMIFTFIFVGGTLIVSAIVFWLGLRRAAGRKRTYIT
jgi:hypothetical protein